MTRGENQQYSCGAQYAYGDRVAEVWEAVNLRKYLTRANFRNYYLESVHHGGTEGTEKTWAKVKS